MQVQITQYFVEAIVPNDNHASQKVAARALGADPEQIRDRVSGKPSSKYLRLFKV
ncbi:hypothetical protein D9M69_662860 [compost metagenome]